MSGKREEAAEKCKEKKLRSNPTQRKGRGEKHIGRKRTEGFRGKRGNVV